MGTINDDTIIAPATIPGTGAISLLRISGPKAIDIADTLVTFRNGTAAAARPNSIKFGTVYRHNGRSESKDGIQAVDDVLACIYKAPHSYTGEDSVEIMCHASSYIVSEIVSYTLSLGARFALPGEFTQRAFLNGKMDLTQAEAVADVVASSTEASHRVAVNQLKGGFSSQLKALRAQLLDMASLLELELDFSEEDVEFADRKRLDNLLDAVIAKVDYLAGSFKLGNAIKNGVPVAIAGPTNAGKSTLLNSILGEQRAIVSDIAGTTRDTIEETFNVDGVLFRFVDTAGIRDTSGEIEKIGIERSYESVRKAEIVIILLDALTLSSSSISYDGPTKDVVLNILKTVDTGSQKVIIALNKVDSYSEKEVKSLENSLNNFVSTIDNTVFDSSALLRTHLISAKTGKGVHELLKTLSDYEKSCLNNASESSVLVTNIRHWEALVTASKSLRLVKSGLASASPTDLVSEDLRSALSTLGSITGEITTADILGNIFSKFCIGK